MDYEKKIEAYRNAIESVLVDDDYNLDQKYETLNVLFYELHGYEAMLECSQRKSTADNSGGAQ